ncbi:MAG: hypothetical protein WCV85_00915 [Patescibacteria group bacterium]
MESGFFFGWNAATVGFIGLLSCTVIEVWGLLLQAKTIWRNQSVQSLSVYMLGYQFIFLIIGLVYGFAIADIGVTINSFLLALCMAIILWGVQLFRGFSVGEILYLAGLIVILVGVTLLPQKDISFFVCSIGSILTFFAQPYKIWRCKDAGVVEVKLLWVLFISTVFWTLYAYGTDNWVLKITSPSFLVVLGLTIGIWIRYRNPKYR